MAQTEGCMTGTVQSGLPLSNIPIINLLREFQLWDKWIHGATTVRIRPYRADPHTVANLGRHARGSSNPDSAEDGSGFGVLCFGGCVDEVRRIWEAYSRVEPSGQKPV